MAMEPISSVVSFQSQNYQQTQVKPATATPKQTQEYVEVPKNGTQPVDQTVVTVKNAEDTNLNQDGGGNGAGYFAQRNGKNANIQVEKPEEIVKKEHEKLRAAVEEMNKKLGNSEAQFGIHEATNRVTIKLVDKDTHEVIKELPPEKTLDLIAKTLEMAGLLIDEKR